MTRITHKEVEYYMDDWLHRGSQKIKARLSKKDEDHVMLVDGAEGTGKSTVAIQYAAAIDPNLTLDNICFTPEQFKTTVLNARPRSAIVFDEAFTGFSSRSALSNINRVLVSLMMEIRQRNLAIIIVMPTFFMLDKYVALHRSHGLIHTYKDKKGNKGRWIYFNSEEKKIVYLLGKQLLRYSGKGFPRAKRRGRFFAQYVVNDDAYRKKKSDALKEKSFEPTSQNQSKHMIQRDMLIKAIKEEKKFSYTQLVDYCHSIGFKTDRNTCFMSVKRAAEYLENISHESEESSDESS